MSICYALKRLHDEDEARRLYALTSQGGLALIRDLEAYMEKMSANAEGADRDRAAFMALVTRQREAFIQAADENALNIKSAQDAMNRITRLAEHGSMVLNEEVSRALDLLSKQGVEALREFQRDLSKIHDPLLRHTEQVLTELLSEHRESLTSTAVSTQGAMAQVIAHLVTSSDALHASLESHAITLQETDRAVKRMDERLAIWQQRFADDFEKSEKSVGRMLTLAEQAHDVMQSATNLLNQSRMAVETRSTSSSALLSSFISYIFSKESAIQALRRHATRMGFGE